MDKTFTELSNDQYETLFHLSDELDVMEAMLRARGKNELVDDLVEFQIRAGIVYDCEAQRQEIPENIRAPSVEEMRELFREIRSLFHIDKRIRNLFHTDRIMETKVEDIMNQLGLNSPRITPGM